METNFTPVSALIGGALIGAAAVLLMAAHGRVMGVRGIVGGLLPPWTAAGTAAAASDHSWRLAFLAGCLAAPLVYSLVQGLAGGALPALTVIASLPVALAAGLIVGVGTTLGAGCTSGHGVCGLARLSGRSLAATAIFMATAAVTVFVTRHVVAG